MHQYAGNPAFFPANVGLVDDSDLNPATAAALDVAGQNLADRTAFLYRLGNQIGENWQAPIDPGFAAVDIARPAWDPVNAQWVLAGAVGTSKGGLGVAQGQPGATSTFSGSLSGSAWPTGNFTQASVAKEPSDSVTFYFAGVEQGSQAAQVYSYNAGTGVYTQVLNDTTTLWADAQIICFKGSLVLALTATTANTSHSAIRYSTNMGSTWNVGATGTQYTDCATSWNLQVSGSLLVCLASELSAVPIGGTAPIAVVTSPDGVTFTGSAIGAAAAGALNASGLAWTVDAGGPCWIMSFHLTGGSGKTSFARSADGVTWTASGGNLLHTNILDMAAIGSILVALTQYTDGTFAIYSPDGANTWYRSQAKTPWVSGGVGVRIGSSPNQVAWVVPTGSGHAPVIFSECYGTSGVLLT
jgi:hypothetical protein